MRVMNLLHSSACVCFFLNQEQGSFQAVRLQELTPLLVLTGAPWLPWVVRCAVLTSGFTSPGPLAAWGLPRELNAV